MIDTTNKYITTLPIELVEQIVDYHNYEKYCKPKHQSNLKNVLNDIRTMNSIFETDTHTILPFYALKCWGKGFMLY
jgi:hypothetical protein